VTAITLIFGAALIFQLAVPHQCGGFRPPPAIPLGCPYVRARMAVGIDMKSSAKDSGALRDHLLFLLKGGGAHVGFDDAIQGLAVPLRGKRPKGAGHSPWEILEHMRLAQWDILEFSRDPNHKSPIWPEGYWPQTRHPVNTRAWAKSVQSFRADREAMCKLVTDESTHLFARVPWGSGQTVLREALLVADHNAYHLGEMVLVRRLLGAWK
jgi:hypothetical protein